MSMPTPLAQQFDPNEFRLSGGHEIIRRLSDLNGCFADANAFAAALRLGNPVIYRVLTVEPASGPGDLHYGLGIVYPGKVGREYFLTRGHLHETRESAEVYIGQSGDGFMILEDEITQATRLEPLGAGRVVYVPGHTAHRTVNTGGTPLTYFGVYPAKAGHDYGVISLRNFLKVVIE